MSCRVLACLCAVLIPAAVQADCASPEQVKAAQLRQMHYQLQVAALNCRGDYPDMPGKWQAYVQRHGAALGANARTMQGYFKSATAFDRHNTRITNRESVRVHDHPDYCGMSDAVFDKVVTLGAQQLAAYAGELVGRPTDIPACPTRTAMTGEKKGENKKTAETKKPASP
ncbi:heme utilization protein [Magnetospirillum sp. SS-4]|uniref:heme utilization protein n=1 Tax=Magnetospirillum sp. SS-4 TaxID=2681465 RepID=UPI00137E93A4|nr:heme utilization protein [Magnetospirillum sp. SS-4]CAA7619906.1 conserved exported hypothetical protein [Magnetospirillum sp. SS-4]